MNNSKANASPLLELIPSSELERKQITVSYRSNEVSMYKFLRVPLTIHELIKKRVAIWMKNGTFVLLNCLHTSVSPFSSPNVNYSNGTFRLHFYLDDQTNTSCQMFGVSVAAVLETAVCFTGLKVSAGRTMDRLSIEIDGIRFDASHSEQLARLFDEVSTRNFTFSSTTLESVLCKVIFTRPYPIDLKFECYSVPFEELLDHLQSRTTSFGSFTWSPENSYQNERIRLLNHPEFFDHVETICVSRSLTFKLLSTPIKSICFAVRREVWETDLSTADIVPPNIHIRISSQLLSVPFTLSFFQRVAELGHLESLTIECYCCFRGVCAPLHLGQAFVHAVHANKNLKVLELLGNRNVWNRYLKELLDILGTHEGLRTLRIEHYPYTPLDPTFAWIKQLLQRNRRIEITGVRGNCWEEDPELRKICAWNRLYCGSQKLKQESPTTRFTLLATALTYRAAGDFPRTGLLLSDQMDSLCEFFQERVPTGGGGC